MVGELMRVMVKNIFIKHIFALLLLNICLVRSIFSNEKQNYNRVNVDQTVLTAFFERVSKYDTSISYFTHVDKDSQKFRGVMMFKKNFGIRFNYFDEYPILIAMNKNNAYVYDYDTNNLNIIRSKDNPLAFLVHDKNKLSKNIEIIESRRVANEYIVSFSHKDTEALVNVHYDYKKNMFSSIEIKHPDDNVLKIVFDSKINLNDLDKRFFSIKSPIFYGKPKKLQKADIVNLQQYKN